MARVFLLLLLLGLLLPLSIGAEEDAGELEALLAKIKRAAAGIDTLQSAFVQEKSLAIFEQRLVSRGVMIYQQPDQLRWEMLSPVASGFVLHGQKGVRWNAVSRQIQGFSVAADPLMGVVAQQLLAWARIDLDWLQQRYRMALLAAAPVALQLTPLDPDEAQFVRHLEVTFDPLQAYVSSVLVVEMSGDSTLLEFADVHINAGVAEGAFLPPEF